MSFYDYYREPKFSKIMRLLEVLDEVAAAHNQTVPQTVINWSTQQKSVGTALVGVNTVKQAKENCSAFDWELTNAEMEKINTKILEIDLDNA